MKNYQKILAAIVFCVALAVIVSAQFEIKQGTIASGGGDSGSIPFAVTGTAGQPVAGTRSTGGAFAVTSGFWVADGATAANVSVSGRVLTAQGAGLRSAWVVLTDMLGISRRGATSSFGYYRFDDVRAGETYVMTVSSKRFQFLPRTLNVVDELTDVDFIAEGEVVTARH